MRIDEWLKWAREDAAQRGMPDLAPMLETFARSTLALREADRRSRATATDAVAATGHLSKATDR